MGYCDEILIKLPDNMIQILEVFQNQALLIFSCAVKISLVLAMLLVEPMHDSIKRRAYPFIPFYIKICTLTKEPFLEKV